MSDLGHRYADRGVTSVFLYTREAHPGENYRHHTSMDLKRSHARAFRDHSNVSRRILLDDLEGTVHHAYGLLPNMTWIMAPGGRIAYKAMWTDSDDVEDALATFVEGYGRRREDHLVPFQSERLSWRVSDQAAFRAGLERTGPQAVRDFYGE